VARLPWVADSSVRKLYPGTIQVAIVERTPFALWQHDGAISLIDREGRKIVELDDPRFAGLPLVVGAGAGAPAQAFLAALGAHPALAERTRAGVLVAERRWNLVLDNGITVKLPEGDIAPAMARLAELAARDDLLRREVSEIDLRLPDRISVRLPREAAQARIEAIEAEAARLARAAARP
jgi:cell division protein FtsQ